MKWIKLAFKETIELFWFVGLFFCAGSVGMVIANTIIGMTGQTLPLDEPWTQAEALHAWVMIIVTLGFLRWMMFMLGWLRHSRLVYGENRGGESALSAGD